MFEIGTSLGEARRREGLTLSEVEAATKIRVRYLDALERDRFDLLPPGAYRQSFLREYAEFLGLDGDVYAAEYHSRFGAPEPEPFPTPVREMRSRLPVKTMIVVGGVVLAALGAWLLGGKKDMTTASPPTLPVRLHPSHQPAARPLTPNRTAQRAKTTALVMRASTGDCWLSVRVGGDLGPVAFQRTLLQGESVRFGLRRPLWIRLGAPWNLNATIAGRVVSNQLPQQTGNILVTAGGVHPSTS